MGDYDQPVQKNEQGYADPVVARHKRTGKIVGICIVLVTIVLVLLAAHRMTVDPRTEDASVGAHYIGMAPEVEGRVTILHVTDNACVKQGQILVEIDSQQYTQSLEKALANQRALEAQIVEEQRMIAAGNHQIAESRAGLESSRLSTKASAARVASSAADVDSARAALAKATATYELAKITVNRNEPLHAKKYISDQDFDQLKTNRDDAIASMDQARAQVAMAEANLSGTTTTSAESEVNVAESEAALSKAIYSVPLLDTLLAELPARQADVDRAKLDLDRTHIFAPFDGCVVSLNIAEGAVAKAGYPLFTLIDENSWYVDADFRESQLAHIWPGMKADVFLMTDRRHLVPGVVQSVSKASKSSDTDYVGGTPGSPGSLPVVERTLNWVILASRYAVRIKIQPQDPSLLRIGTTAAVELRR
jgi:membrane fusion protein, multidrug efflux system